MSTFSSVLAAFCLLAVVGCDGGSTPSKSGVDGSKYLDKLSTDELRQFCAWRTSILKPGRYECPDGRAARSFTSDECVASVEKEPLRHCKVLVFEDCISSTNGDACLFLWTDACKTYSACPQGN